MIWFLTVALAGDIPVDSEVVQATVYTDRARVTREITTRVPAGRTDLIFEGLSIHLLTETLSAEGEGIPATLTGIDVRPVRGTEDRDKRVAELREERQEIADRIVDQQDAAATAQADIVFLTALKPQAPEKLTEATFLAADAPEQLASLGRDIGRDLERAYEKKRQAERAIRDLQKEVGRIDRELAKIETAGNTDAQRVAVGLDAKRAGDVTVRLTYLVTQASWRPHYAARFDLDKERVTLDVSGEVSQQTGEDWDDVALVLSTAQPQERTSPPELSPFVLRHGAADARAGGGGARVTAHEFVARDREDVPADGTLRRVRLDTVGLKGDVVHEIVPRSLQSAWLTVEAENAADYTLLPGTVSSYLGSAYVGDGNLPLVAPGDELSLSFGVDDRIGVKREAVSEVESDAKPLQNKERSRRNYVTTIENHTDTTTKVKVRDQVPASRNAQYEVEMELVPEVEVPNDGVFTWELELKPGETIELTTAYTVSWPTGDPPNSLLDP